MVGGAKAAVGGAAVTTCGVRVSCGAAKAGVGAVVVCLVGPLIVFWWCCWWTTRVVNTPSMVTALASMTSRILFVCAQRKFIYPPGLPSVNTNSR